VGDPDAPVDPLDALDAVDARPSAEDRSWWDEPDPVDVFSAGLELALRRLRAEIAAVRAERDGLRLEIEGLRVKLAIAQEQLAARDNLADTVRELQQAVANLTLAATSRAAPSPFWEEMGRDAVPDSSQNEESDRPVELEREPEPEPEPAAVVEAPPAEPTALERLRAMGLWPPPSDGVVAHLPAAPAAVDAEPEPDPFEVRRRARLEELARLRGELRDDTAPTTGPSAPEAERTRDNVISWDRLSARRLPALIDGDDRAFALRDLDDDGRGRRTGRLRRAVRVAGTIAGAIAVVLVLLVTVGPKVLPYQTYFVRSGSMEPTIQTGAMVVLTETGGGNLDVGDIITFEKPDDPSVLVTHRIVDVETNEQGRVFVTKGDANANPDPWRVPASGTGWVYAFDVPYLGYLFGFLNNWQVRIALLAVAVGAFGVLLLLDRIRPGERRR